MLLLFATIVANKVANKLRIDKAIEIDDKLVSDVKVCDEPAFLIWFEKGLHY